MSRATIVLGFLFSLVLLAVGGFLVGNALLSVPPPQNVDVAQSILDEARQRIPQPPLPPKPGGREVEVTVPTSRTIQVPKIVYDNLKMPFGASVKVPRQTLETQTITENIKKTTIVDASPDEISAWNSQVAESQAEYNRRLNEEIKKISAEQAAKNARLTSELIKDMITSVVIPLIVALTGLIGAIVSLINALRKPPPGNPKPPELTPAQTPSG
jgi:hypothetical protein